MNLIYLDTETTGIEEPRLVQLAYISECPNNEFNSISKEFNGLFKPSKPIEYGAMAVSHITNEMVEDKESFSNSMVKNELSHLINSGVVIAHNAKFDVKVLEVEGITCPKVIDTQKCAKHLFDYDGNYSLQELRYAMGIYKKIDNSKIIAHDAMGDVIVLREIFNELKNLSPITIENKNDLAIVNYLCYLTNNPLYIQKVKFGKYGPKGTHAPPPEKKFYSWEEVAQIDIGYIRWLYSSEKSKSASDQDIDLIFTLEKIQNVF